MRDEIATDALTSWFKLLYHVINYNHAAPGRAAMQQVQEYLAKILHETKREDNLIVCLSMRVWAMLLFCGNELRTTYMTMASFDEVCETVCLNGMAYLLAQAVDPKLLPQVYRQNAPLEFPDLYEVNDAGVLVLFAHWHVQMVARLFLNKPSLPIELAADETSVLPVFTPDESVSLQRLRGLSVMEEAMIYTHATDTNIFKIIRTSGLSHEELTLIANTMFESNTDAPDCPDTPYAVLARAHQLPMTIGDEILWSTGRTLWLQRKATDSRAAIVVDRQIQAWVPYAEVATLSKWLKTSA